MSTWDDPLVKRVLADADLSVTCRRWTSEDDMSDSDDKERIVKEFLDYLTERGLAICNVSNAIYWPVNTATMAERFAGKPSSWVKPDGCVCAGPSDPYHGWCEACRTVVRTT